MAPNVAGDLSVWVHGTRSPVAASYINSILNLLGQKSLPSGGDIGTVTPVGALPPTNTGPVQCGTLDRDDLYSLARAVAHYPNIASEERKGYYSKVCIRIGNIRCNFALDLDRPVSRKRPGRSDLSYARSLLTASGLSIPE